MSKLPTGTITFLFTDIEGSTRLLQRLGGDAYRDVQELHGAILRGAIAEGGGTEIRTEGDSFFAVFPTADGALLAAVNAQRGLDSTNWPEGVTIRVRMGMHTGQGVLGSGGADYVGIDVNRAARIAAAGSGGQILLSQATVQLVLHTLPPGVSIRDLGHHRLKDLDHAEHICDLVVDGLSQDFPNLRALDARPTNLPPQRTSFIGRQREIADIADLLKRTRLLTLTGPGGTGKTRLALKVAAQEIDRYPDGVFLVDLSAVSDPALVLTEVAAVLHVRESPDTNLEASITDFLQSKEMLLLLDNMEQLPEASPLIGRLLDAGPGLTVLATSRTPLHVTGEFDYQVDPLPLPTGDRPTTLERLTRFDSVALFVERAAAVRQDFHVSADNVAAVAEIVGRVDGLPLALELAASRVKVLSPNELAARIKERLPLLTGGGRDAPERQQTLRSTIRWSYDLLAREEQKLFARLAAFSGGWTLKAAETICGPALSFDVLEGVQSLVENSLVQHRETDDGESRFLMLETIGEFACELLASSDEEDLVRGRHAEYFRDLAENAEPYLTGEHRLRWIRFFEYEHDNVRSALDWSEGAGDLETALRIASSLWRFWQQAGYLGEARERLDRLTRRRSEDISPWLRARALGAFGGIAFWQMDYQAMKPAYEEAAELARRVGDPRLLAHALYDLSFVPNIVEGEIDRAEEIIREALKYAAETEDHLLLGRLWTGLGYLHTFRGNVEDAIACIERGTAIYRQSGDSLSIAENLVSVAGFEFLSGRFDEARAHLDEAVDILAASESPIMFAPILFPLAVAANHESDYARTARLLGAFESMRALGGGGPPAVAMAQFGDPEAESRAVLGDAEFERAWAEGRALTADEIVAYAARGDSSE